MSAKTYALIERIETLKNEITEKARRNEDVATLEFELSQLTRQLTEANNALSGGKKLITDVASKSGEVL